MTPSLAALTDLELARMYALVGFPYELDLTVTDVVGNQVWSIESGTLPVGMFLDTLPTSAASIGKIHSSDARTTTTQAMTRFPFLGPCSHSQPRPAQHRPRKSPSSSLSGRAAYSGRRALA